MHLFDSDVAGGTLNFGHHTQHFTLARCREISVILFIEQHSPNVRFHILGLLRLDSRTLLTSFTVLLHNTTVWYTHTVSMLLTIDIADSKAIYQQIADGVRLLIASGGLKEGVLLPSVRQLANDLGVNLNTVATAYRELQEEGLLVIRAGSGCVVAPRKATDAKPAELRKPLRSALAQFVLAGLNAKQIRTIVDQELRDLVKEGRL
jgi:GntR family transcriptional regulator